MEPQKNNNYPIGVDPEYRGWVTVGSSSVYVRSAPSRTAPLAGSRVLSPGTRFEVVGWTYGEMVEGENRWWISKYGNYVWVGGTIEKPPRVVTAPPPTPPRPAPAAPAPQPVVNIPSTPVSSAITTPPTVQSAGAPLVSAVQQSVNNLISGVNNAIQSVQALNPIPKLERFVDDALKFFRDLFEKIGEIATNIAKIVWELFDEKGWLRQIFIDLQNFLKSISKGFLEFLTDPFGKLKEWSSDIVNSIRNLLLEIGDWINYVADLLWHRIKDYFEIIKYLIKEEVYKPIEKLWQNIANTLDNLVHEILDPIGQTFSALWEGFKRFFTEKVPSWFEGLALKLGEVWSRITESFKVSFSGIYEFFKNIWEIITGEGVAFERFKSFLYHLPVTLAELAVAIFKKILELLGKILPPGVVEGLFELAKGVFNWVRSLLASISNFIVETSKIFVPSAPSPEEDPEAKAKALIAKGLEGLIGLAGIGAIASIVSKIGIPYVGGMLADFASFRYISEAIMGALVLAVYKQPLTYAFKAYYRPYLPSFRDVFTAYSRNIISDDEFLFFLKYEGIPDKYLPIYKRLASDPLSPRTVRQFYDFHIIPEERIKFYISDIGYDEQKVEDIHLAFKVGALKDEIKEVLKYASIALSKGYLTKEEFLAIREETLRNLDQRWLIEKAAELAFRLEILDAIYDSIVEDLKDGYITEEEARKKLSEYIKVPEKIDAVIKKVRAKKIDKPEPDKGKELRNTIKRVIRDCYKEGFITSQKLEMEIDAVNKLTDERDLTILLAEWEAFYDDMVDQVRNYKNAALDELITIDELRQRLTNLGMRPRKIELIVRDVAEFLADKHRKEIEKLEVKLSRLEDKRRGIIAALIDLEAKLEIESKPAKIMILERKYNTKLAELSKVEEEISLLRDELARLT